MTEKVNYEAMTDEDLVLLAQRGDEAAMRLIVDRYESFVKMRSGPYFIAGAAEEDLLQEGRIGLYKAVRSYESDKKAGFKTFAELCIVRQMISAVKTSTRKKNQPLNRYVSVHTVSRDGDEEQEENRYDSMEDPKNGNPESIMIEKEDARGMASEINALLSEFEYQVLGLYLEGMSYRSIAAYMKKDPKAVDNALQRIKKKVEKYLEGEV
ncbi:MAG: RNA polymerase sporulation sigma factor SigH [Clostridia bacterium]|nr:RNA polymerase sporulation sigma factor SigH [Clostridia bacterium]